MKPGTINRFLGKVQVQASAEAVVAPQFADLMAAYADFIVALHKRYMDDFGDEQVFLDSASNLWIVAK